MSDVLHQRLEALHVAVTHVRDVSQDMTRSLSKVETIVDAHEKRIGKLASVTIEGNGQESLLTRVKILEGEFEEQKDAIERVESAQAEIKEAIARIEESSKRRLTPSGQLEIKRIDARTAMWNAFKVWAPYIAAAGSVLYSFFSSKGG